MQRSGRAPQASKSHPISPLWEIAEDFEHLRPRKFQEMANESFAQDIRKLPERRRQKDHWDVGQNK